VTESTPSANISTALASVRADISAAAAAAGRADDSVQLLAVSKTRPHSDIASAWQAGQRAFGENYVDEALEKMGLLAHSHPAANIEWHFIGAIQSRKASAIAQHFQWVHSVDRLKVAQRLAKHRPPDMGTLSVCIQVNLDAELSKSGVHENDVSALADAIAALPQLCLRGLMCIPAPRSDPAEQRAVFRRLAKIQHALKPSFPTLDTLSMGMSGDMQAAIAEGANIVRVGTAIFGARTYK